MGDAFGCLYPGDASRIGGPSNLGCRKAASLVTIGRLAPTPDDIGMLRLLCLVLTTQLGGLVLLFARR